MFQGLLLFSTPIHAQWYFNPTRYPQEVVEAVRAPYKASATSAKSHLSKLSSLTRKYADKPDVLYVLHETMKYIYYWDADFLNVYRQSDAMLGTCEEGLRTQELVKRADYSAMAHAQHPDKVSAREVMDCYHAAYQAVKEQKPIKWADFYFDFAHHLVQAEKTPENIQMASSLALEALAHKQKVETDSNILQPLSIQAFCWAINADNDTGAFALLKERTAFWSHVSSNLVCQNEQRIRSAFALSPATASGFMDSAKWLGVYANKAPPEKVIEVGDILLSKINSSPLADEEKKPALHQTLRIVAGMHYRLKQKAQGDKMLARIKE